MKEIHPWLAPICLCVFIICQTLQNSQHRMEMRELNRQGAISCAELGWLAGSEGKSWESISNVVAQIQDGKQ